MFQAASCQHCTNSFDGRAAAAAAAVLVQVVEAAATALSCASSLGTRWTAAAGNEAECTKVAAVVSQVLCEQQPAVNREAASDDSDVNLATDSSEEQRGAAADGNGIKQARMFRAHLLATQGQQQPQQQAMEHSKQRCPSVASRAAVAAAGMTGAATVLVPILQQQQQQQQQLATKAPGSILQGLHSS
jgi:hypothetical protein